MDEGAAVAVQIGRQPRSEVLVVARSHLGLPVVTRVPPILDDGTPFPTLYWLGCPLAAARVSSLESRGGVRTADAMLESDPDLRAAQERAMQRYRRHRDELLPEGHEGPAPSGGIGGGGAGVKCLHAHYADHAAGNDDPIGAWAAEWVEPLDCTDPCVIQIGGVVVANPRWKAPTPRWAYPSGSAHAPPS